jgi:hypothetical protein
MSDSDEKNKKRTIRNLLNGKRKTVSRSIIDKYKWTVDELEQLKPYITDKKPYAVLDILTTDNGITKKEIYDTLEQTVDNERTLQNYKSRVNSLLALCDVDDEDFFKIFREDLVERIINHYKDPTPYFGFILFILSKSQKLLNLLPVNAFQMYKDQFEESKNTQTIKYLEERKKHIDYEKVYKHIFETEKELRKNEFASMKHLIAVLYTHALYDENGIIHINPRNYFILVQLVTEDSDMNKTDNFYNFRTGRFVLNQYKTSGVYVPYDVYFSKAVQDIIRTSIERTPRTFLVEKASGGIYKNNSLSEMIQRILSYNIDTIRKSIESYEINIKKTNRLHLANVSRHSVLTQEVSYLSK